MGTNARACVVSGCPAMAVADTDTCQVHRLAQRYPKGRVATLCALCQQTVKVGDWVKTETLTFGFVEHVRCPRPRVAGNAPKEAGDERA